MESFLYFDPDRPWTSSERHPTGLTDEEYENYIKELAQEAVSRRNLESRRTRELERSASGTLKAHMFRGGPVKYRKAMQAKKIYKEYVRQVSRMQLEVKEEGDDSGAFFKEDPYANDLDTESRQHLSVEQDLCANDFEGLDKGSVLEVESARSNGIPPASMILENGSKVPPPNLNKKTEDEVDYEDDFSHQSAEKNDDIGKEKQHEQDQKFVPISGAAMEDDDYTSDTAASPDKSEKGESNRNDA